MSKSRVRLSAIQLWMRVDVAIEVAPILDRLGYERFWLSEHHGRLSHSGNPLLLTGIIAGLTEHLRVGPAGVLLPYRSPFLVAEDSRMLSLLYPGRIDLGIAKGGRLGDRLTSAILDGGSPIGRWITHEDRICQLLRYLSGADAGDEDSVAVPAGDVPVPDVWILGSSELSAVMAGRLALPFCYSEYLGGRQNGGEIMRAYYAALPGGVEPRAAVCVSGVCAHTNAAAKALAEMRPQTDCIVGTPNECRQELDIRGRLYGTNDFIFADLSSDLLSKVSSYELLAAACELQ